MADQSLQVKAQRTGLPAFLANVPRPLLARVSKVEEKADPPRVKDAVEDAPTVLPPVISVKKSHRGCAVVLLRDLDIVERCVLQRVAVVDGVCVEMTRHTKKSRSQEDQCNDQPAGIFVAWGIRVERKVPVSAEGIEEFFNSLAGKPCPNGLVASPPFQEGHVSFPLASNAFAPMSWNIRPAPATKEEILSSKNCRQDRIEALWAAKVRLDDLWDLPPPPMARSLMMRVARAQLFPCSGNGGKEHENRAGDKLAEISELTDLLDGIPAGSAFLDLCGGPGAWSQHLLEKQDLALRGFGFTLKADSGAADDWKAQEKDEWYPDLYQRQDWTALWGADGTGDLLKRGNLEHCVAQLAKEQVLLCVADGGFSDDAIPQNLQELYFYRLFLAELLTAVSCLGQGGKFVCKLYTSFSSATSALLFLSTRLFDHVEIVKPVSSKATGPERYLVASGFRDTAESSAIQAALERTHAAGAGASPLVTPLLTPLVDVDDLARDHTFNDSMNQMVSALCERQTQALNAVVDRAIFLENMAMDCAVCTDPWSRSAPKQDTRDQEERMHKTPTPARSGRQGGKANGKGKGYGRK
jgi:cap1 methyltransferase